MEQALGTGPAEAAELVAGECVVQRRDEGPSQLGVDAHGRREAPTADRRGDHRERSTRSRRRRTSTCITATGWTRELWIESLGIPAVLPPPEEQKDVKTAIGAARAKNAREDMTG